MSSAGASEVLAEFRRPGAGMAGAAILGALVCVSAAAAALVPAETLRDWNDPGSWVSLPRAAAPAWVNWLSAESVPEHLVLGAREAEVSGGSGVAASSVGFVVDYRYDGLPSDVIYELAARYTGAPLLKVHVERPDGLRLELISEPLPHSGAPVLHEARFFSADGDVRKGLEIQAAALGLPSGGAAPEDVVFSRADGGGVLKGRYGFTASVYSEGGGAGIESSRLILGGRAYGAMGTDELRRDLAVGLLWGTPLALFIGVAVAAGSVAMGLLYGVYAGYRGGRPGEAMMRLNDVVYALPALPFLIILAVTVGNSILLMVGFLMMFGWVGVAKVARSMALQIRTRGYVEAAQVMGQGDARIVLRHVLPQLLPYAFASIAISVPAAITTEAGLSFLGLGDPSFPTWGQMLHDANVHGAAARGLWWWIVPPGMMIAATGLAFVFIGSALDGVANPRLRRGRRGRAAVSPRPPGP